jgi:tRNA (guanine-N7-)-methyltransferase
LRSFHARRGRLGDRRTAAIERLWPDYGIEPSGEQLDLGQTFGAPVVLEIGFGMGDATVEMAGSDPATGVLACDVHDAGVAHLLLAVEEQGLENVRVCHGDAFELLRQRVPEGSLAGVRIFFPDPWPKARHRKRRLIQPPFVALLASRLGAGGFVHCATDWPDYAEQMLAVLSDEPLLRNAHEGFAPTAGDRATTRYERRGLAKGHSITDLVFIRA